MSQSDPDVASRRNFHMAAANFCARWLTLLQAFFGLIGLTIVLLPVLLEPWRTVVENTKLLSRVFHDYSTFSGLALINLFAGMFTAIIKPWLGQEKKHFEGISFAEMTQLEAFPKTQNDEILFWFNVISSVFLTTVWLFLPFGAIAFFIRLGS